MELSNPFCILLQKDFLRDMIYVYDKKKDLAGRYQTIKKAADATGTTPFEVTEALQNKVKLLKGFVFSNQELRKFRKRQNCLA